MAARVSPERALDILPTGRLEIGDERVDPHGMTADEVPIQNLDLVFGAGAFVFLDQRFHQALEHRNVAADAHLVKLRADRSRGE